MEKPIENPAVPFSCPVNGGFQPGKMVRIQGSTPQGADRFNINLQTAPNADIGLHVSVRLMEGYIARNSCIGGAWGEEHGHGNQPIAPGQMFEVLLLCEPQDFKIAVNGQHFTEFPHRLPFNQLTNLSIDGAVTLSLVVFESAGPPPAAPNPNMMPNQPPPNFGQAGPGGVPPPPGHQPQESGGVGDFLEQAAPFLSGVIKSGAVEKLFGSFGGSGQSQQGAPPQQQQQYAPPPQQQQQQQPPIPNQLNPQNVGGQGSIGGLGSVGSILTNLAGELFSGAQQRKKTVGQNMMMPPLPSHQVGFPLAPGQIPHLPHGGHHLPHGGHHPPPHHHGPPSFIPSHPPGHYPHPPAHGPPPNIPHFGPSQPICPPGCPVREHNHHGHHGHGHHDHGHHGHGHHDHGHHGHGHHPPHHNPIITPPGYPPGVVICPPAPPGYPHTHYDKKMEKKMRKKARKEMKKHRKHMKNGSSSSSSSSDSD